MDLLHKELTDAILKTFYDVYNELGYGFLEKAEFNVHRIKIKGISG